jgi:hypothetical protein
MMHGQKTVKQHYQYLSLNTNTLRTLIDISTYI